MVDEGNPNCDHQYPRGSEWCAICGRYRHADQVKELVAKAPPLSQDQINRISLIFSSTAKDIDWTAVAAEGVMADVIQRTAWCATPSNARAARTSVGPRIGAATSPRLSTGPWRQLASSASAEPPSDERRRRPARPGHPRRHQRGRPRVCRVGSEHLITDDDRLGRHRLLCWLYEHRCQRRSARIGPEGGLAGSRGRTGKTSGA